MKVVFTPKWDDANPYQQLLMDSLEEQGVETSIREHSFLFTFIQILLFERDVDIIHLIWIDPFFLQKYGQDDSRCYIAITWIVTLLRAPLFIVDILLCRIFGIKFVWTVHDKYNHEGCHKSLQVFISIVLARIVDSIKVECPKAKEIIRDLYRIPDSKNINVIHEGHYMEYYPNEIDTETARDHLNLEPDELVFLYFGSIRSYKGTPELLETFLDLDSSINAKLLVVGQPRDDASLESVLKRAKRSESIELIVEYVADDDVQKFFNAADVVVLPFRDVLTSGSTLMALGFGRPMIVPRVGCIGDIVPDDNFLYDQNESGLATAIERAIESDDLERIGKTNLEAAAGRPWDEAARETVRFYDNAI